MVTGGVASSFYGGNVGPEFCGDYSLALAKRVGQNTARNCNSDFLQMILSDSPGGSSVDRQHRCSAMQSVTDSSVSLRQPICL